MVEIEKRDKKLLKEFLDWLQRRGYCDADIFAEVEGYDPLEEEFFRERGKDDS